MTATRKTMVPKTSWSIMHQPEKIKVGNAVTQGKGKKGRRQRYSMKKTNAPSSPPQTETPAGVKTQAHHKTHSFPAKSFPVSVTLAEVMRKRQNGQARQSTLRIGHFTVYDLYPWKQLRRVSRRREKNITYHIRRARACLDRKTNRRHYHHTGKIPPAQNPTHTSLPFLLAVDAGHFWTIWRREGYKTGACGRSGGFVALCAQTGTPKDRNDIAYRTQPLHRLGILRANGILRESGILSGLGIFRDDRVWPTGAVRVDYSYIFHDTWWAWWRTLI